MKDNYNENITPSNNQNTTIIQTNKDGKIGQDKCPKCGCYSLLDYKCFNCGYDKSMREDLDNG